ncbi:MAG: DUF1987 domain-containing protein [Bacteroidales bacterium]|nr:DUF1987 domain-containing protein [Bacteroidales bacterium]
MEKLLREPTPYSPYVDFRENGILIMKGRAFPENALEFFGPLILFTEELEVERIVLDLDLEYFNTASAKKLLDLMKAADGNSKVNNVIINWRFEEGDDDSVETAEIFEESLSRAKFNYIEYCEVVP